METTVKKQNYFIPIIVMILLFGMISFVTNLASPMGDILKNQFNTTSRASCSSRAARWLARTDRTRHISISTTT